MASLLPSERAELDSILASVPEQSLLDQPLEKPPIRANIAKRITEWLTLADYLSQITEADKHDIKSTYQDYTQQK